jgi:hypothetical protein
MLPGALGARIRAQKTPRSSVAFWRRGVRFVFVETQQHRIDADLRPGSRLAFFALALVPAFSFVFLFLLTRMFLLAFRECGSASG